MKPYGRSEGFTLIELMVAITILAIVAVLSWRGLEQIIRARTMVVAMLDQERSLAQFYEQLERDAGSVVDENEVVPAPISLNGGLRLIRRVRLPDQPDRLQVVRYVFDGEHMTRYASPLIANQNDLNSTLGDPGTGPGWSVYPLGLPAASVTVRAFVDGTGWTTQDVDILSARKAAQNQPQSFGAQSGVPTGRVVTGLDLAIATPGASAPFDRIVLVGQ